RLMGAAALPLLAACAGGRGEPAPAARTVPPGTTISYLGSHNQAEGQLVGGQMQAFEQKAPGVKVEVSYLTADYMTKLRTLLASGTPPDLFRTGGTPWAQLANQGAMAEIDSRIKRDRFDLSDLIDAAVAQYTWRGKQLGLGSNVGYTLLYYNPEAFRQAGVPLPGDDWATPWTWDQFNDAMRRVTTRQGSGEPDRFGFTALDAYMRLLVTNGATLTDEAETRTLYDTPEAIDTWQWIDDLLRGLNVAQNPLTYREQPSDRTFIQGKAAAWVGSTADGATRFVGQKDLTWDVAPTPRGPRLKSDRWIFGGGSAWWIAAGSPHPDAAWEFLKYMESPEVGQNLALGGFAPIRFSVLNSPAWLRSDQPPKSKRLLVDGLKKLLPFPKLTTWDAYSAAIDAEVQSLWKGERRAREVAERIRAATDPILAEHQRNLKAGR
ncbi:MAG TPA: sugar ABC transporter substrate-binding protein, partial [Chloroflexota bacterium]|nr:sugar ABC transporter substrate-binding protein [Chloroflexota bacterium]